MSRAIVHPEFRTGYMTVSIALEGKPARRLETRIGGSADPGGDDI